MLKPHYFKFQIVAISRFLLIAFPFPPCLQVQVDISLSIPLLCLNMPK